MTIAICGLGRLGGRIAEQLTAHATVPISLRLDREQGLLCRNGELPQQLARLLICLVPAHPDGGSGWSGLLDGLCHQVQRQRLQIGRVLLVSSTAVYECQQRGWVDANSLVHAVSARGAGLLEAEQRLTELAAEHVAVRLAGIMGPGYERYDPIAMSAQQPRHAVDVRAAATLCRELLLQTSPPAPVELVTDGRIYYQQRSYVADKTSQELTELATHHRLLLPSRIAHWP